MKTPPLLIGAALLWWGWLTGQFIPGVVSAVFLEGVRRLDTQWELSDTDYERVWDLCAAIFIGLFIYFYASDEITNSAFHFMQWLPLVFLPIMAAQWLGTREKLPYRIFSWLLRRRPGSPLARRGIDLSFPYFANCLLAASAANPQTVGFYAGFAFLVAWALLAIRPRRYPAWLWALALSLAAVSGYETQRRLHDLQSVVESQLSNWLFRWVRRDFDSRESQTSIGRLGRLKLSNHIIYRVENTGPGPAPALLRETSYNLFRVNTWYAIGKSFVPVQPETNDAWTLLAGQPAEASIRISGALRGGKGVLPLPQGSARIENMPAMEMEKNPMGVVKVAQAPGFAQYRALHGPGLSMDEPPTADDYHVPDSEKEAFAQVARELGLARKSKDEVVRKLRDFFNGAFTYSTENADKPLASRNHQTPLSNFLLKSRTGHCEYFASATVLLLRSATMAARYANGYALFESSGPSRFVVRQSHAHAWGLVWDSEKMIWEELDTTPAGWEALEARKTSFFQPISDFWNGLWYEFNRWRYGKSNLRQYFIALSAILSIILAARILLTKRRALAKKALEANTGTLSRCGGDSEFYLIEKRLAEMHFERDRGETARQWIGRLAQSQDHFLRDLQSIIDLHYRYRFDPAGLDDVDRQALADKARKWLEQWTRPDAKKAP